MLTKPIDLDSPRIRQQMSDGARSLLKVLPFLYPDIESKSFLTGNPGLLAIAHLVCPARYAKFQLST